MKFKKTLLSLLMLCISFAAFSQTIQRPNASSAGIAYKNLLADSAILFPTVPQKPTSVPAYLKREKRAMLWFDSSAHTFMFYDPSTELIDTLRAGGAAASYLQGFGINITGSTIKADTTKLIPRPPDNIVGSTLVQDASGSWLSRLQALQDLWENGNEITGNGSNHTINPDTDTWTDTANSNIQGYAGKAGFGVSDAAGKNATLTTRGIQPPLYTTTQRDAISSPENGLLIKNTTTGTLQQYDLPTTTWKDVAGNAAWATRAFSTVIALDVDNITNTYTQTGPITFTLASSGNEIGKHRRLTIAGNGDSLHFPTNFHFWGDKLPQFDKTNDFDFFFRADGNVDVQVSTRNANYANLMYVDITGFTTYAGYEWTIWNVNNTTGGVITIKAGTTSGGSDIVPPTQIMPGETTLHVNRKFDTVVPVFTSGIPADSNPSVNNPGLNMQ